MLLAYSFLLVACCLLPAPSTACESDSQPQARSSVLRSARSVTTAMEKLEVVPGVIPAAPTGPLTVTYPGGVVVSEGAELKPTQVKDQPQLSWAAEPGALYTVVMTDPDAPSRADPKFGEWRHWLVTNVPGTDLSAGDEVSAYVGSGPPKGTGLHRYVFLVYKQSGKITADEALRKTKNQAKGREKWKVAKFAEQHGLGTPVAGDLYQAQWDDYVPTLYKQFTD